MQHERAPAPLSGQVAVVTGASRGIGRAIALALGQAGADVVIGCRTGIDASQRVAAALERLGCRTTIVAGDVAEPQTAHDLCEAALALGGYDILVNNAGHAQSELLVDTPVETWRRMLAVHLDGAYLCARAALAPMMRNRRGLIINISSMWGQTGAAGEVAYSAAKAGLIGFTRALAKEVGPAGIRVNAVAPGLIESEMLADYNEAERAELVAQTSLGRIGRPEDVADAVLYLAGECYTTGQVLSPNGGFVI